MVKLTDEMKEGLRVPGKGGSLIYLATSSADGKPNIAAMRYIDTYKDDKLLVSDMFLRIDLIRQICFYLKLK